MLSLANKYRPKEFNEICGQSALVKILERQIDTKSFNNCIIFEGHSGCGKTTLARIFANKINDGKGEPIEIDGASNNGVDNVRLITDSAIERSLDSVYKVFIIDEAHMITAAGWNAFLKSIEEPPKYTVFIFCTTDLYKIPLTIINRCQVHHLSRIDNVSIRSRLEYICKLEKYTYDYEALDYITKLSEGSMRSGITYLDKCKDYSFTINIDNVIACLGNYSYDIYLTLTNAVIDGNKQLIFKIFDDLYFDGTDFKLFIAKYLEFIMQLVKYCIFNDIAVTTIPSILEDKVKYTVNIEEPLKFFNMYLDKILKIKQAIKGDSDMKTTIEVMLLN